MLASDTPRHHNLMGTRHVQRTEQPTRCLAAAAGALEADPQAFAVNQEVVAVQTAESLMYPSDRSTTARPPRRAQEVQVELSGVRHRKGRHCIASLSRAVTQARFQVIDARERTMSAKLNVRRGSTDLRRSEPAAVTAWRLQSGVAR
jgi:hypothetical protein